jgi:PAS domain S-box-containing protein
MVTASLLLSLLLRVLGVALAAYLVYRVRDRRFLFLVVMLLLMAVRQAFAVVGVSPALAEVPGFLVSVLAVALVFYLLQYVRQERATKARLREANEELRRFRRAVETAGNAIYITDDDGTITYVNPTFEEITGYASAEAVGRTPNILDAGVMSDDYFADLWETITAGEVWEEEELINERKDGTPYHAQQTIAPVTDETGEVREFVAIQTDITPLKERERQLRVLSRVLRHNLRNDMNVVLGKARTIERTADGDVAADAAQIERTGEKLLALAETHRDIIDLVEDPDPRRELPILDRVRTQVTQLRAENPDARIDVEVDCPDDVTVVAVPGIERAVREVVENAVVHADRDRPVVDLRVESTPEVVRIRVVDEGPGIPPAVRQILTDEREIDQLSHGTGLGLWLVYWLVTRAGGSISFDENEPRGSVVTIELHRAT